MTLGLLWTAVVAAQQNPKQDPSFNPFLERFIGDEAFRLDHIQYPLPVRLGHEDVQEVEVAKWSRKDVRANLTTILSKQELEAENLDQAVTWRSNTKVEIFQYKPEADLYQLHYIFEKRKGRWLLTSFIDDSM